MIQRYASVSWTPGDVKFLKPDWTMAQCEAFLQAEERRIQELMVARGWDAIETILDFDYQEGKVPT